MVKLKLHAPQVFELIERFDEAASLYREAAVLTFRDHNNDKRFSNADAR